MNTTTLPRDSKKPAHRPMPATLRHIDERRLENDLAYRFGYLSDLAQQGLCENTRDCRIGGGRLIQHCPARRLDHECGRNGGI